MDNVPQFFVGHHDSKRNVPISPALAKQVHLANYDMLTFPITTPHFHSRVLSVLSTAFADAPSTTDGGRSTNGGSVHVGPLSTSDTHLTPDESISSIIGTTSPWIDLGSPDPVIANVSRQVLRLELAYAAFCGVTYVIVPGPRPNNSCDVAAYARAILDGLDQGPYMQLYIWTGIHSVPSVAEEQVGDLAQFVRREYVDVAEANKAPGGIFQTWQAWDTVRALCKYSTRLCLALAIPPTLPSTAVLSRWYSEPVRILTLGSSTFRKNNKGYPALPSEHQGYVMRLMKLKTQPWLLLCDTHVFIDASSQPGEKTDTDFPNLKDARNLPSSQADPHLDYVRHLQRKQANMTAMDQFGLGYQDYLQAPLQPLTVNLESVTYEVFEKDPIKYEWYERAVARALHDWIEQGKPTSNPDGRVVVAVVGAGRGPLVSRALKAAEDVGVDIDMWALEKNPNAFVLLQRHNQTKWNHQVTLVKSDMRTWLGPQTNKNISSIRKTFNVDPEEADENCKQIPAATIPDDDNTCASSFKLPQIHRYHIDILISELLGSFADNELSPECLDGVQHLLNPTHGISIPSSYTAHFTPIAAPKLHADISLSMINVNPTAAEIPYVVMLDQIDFLSTKPVEDTSPSAISNAAKPKSFASLLSSSSASRHSSTSTNSTKTSKTSASPTSPIIHTAWSFHHPDLSAFSSNAALGAPSNAHNFRYCKFSFPIPHQGSCHGLAGYFETVLYPGVELSTNPLTMSEKSDGMISWFPIFFPFKTPIFFPERSVADVSMWRQTDDRKVWYEWLCEVYVIVENGRRIKVGSTALHSSEKEACLM